MPGKLRILVVTRSYPAPGDLYRYPFVHRRVLGYRATGHEVAVFRPSEADAGGYRFDGVDCTVGNGDRLGALVAAARPNVVAVHGLGPAMWPIVEPLTRSLPSVAWLHGSELPGFLGRKCAIDEIPSSFADEQVEQCSDFWRGVLNLPSALARLVFPSEAAVRYMTESVPGASIRCFVIPNPIDDELFDYRPKPPEQRFRVLLIRPFDSRCYANDLAVQTICDLTRRDDLRFEFRIFGDGPLFDETIEPLRKLANVSIQRRFLAQAEIANEHKQSGIFLVPTRLDTQGVSRDEAMSSGLVPVTCAIEPVTDFVDDSCVMLAPPEDSEAMANAVRKLADSPELFARISAAAARHIRSTRSRKSVISADLALLRGVIDG